MGYIPLPLCGCSQSPCEMVQLLSPCLINLEAVYVCVGVDVGIKGQVRYRYITAVHSLGCTTFVETCFKREECVGKGEGERYSSSLPLACLPTTQDTPKFTLLPGLIGVPINLNSVY